MKFIRRFTLLAVLATLVPSARSENANLVNNPDIVINSVSKKLDENTTAPSKGDGSIAEKKEEWGYVLTLENKAFKPVSGLEVKYVVFYKQEQIGAKTAARLKRQSGTGTIQEIAAGGKTTFTTDPVELKKAVLQGNYYFTNGGKTKAEDGLSGIWFRVYQNGKLFAEYVRPASLAGKEKWEAQP